MTILYSISFEIGVENWFCWRTSSIGITSPLSSIAYLFDLKIIWKKIKKKIIITLAHCTGLFNMTTFLVKCILATETLVGASATKKLSTYSSIVIYLSISPWEHFQLFELLKIVREYLDVLNEMEWQSGNAP